MAKEAKQSHQANKILKNAAKATKYSASQIFSDKTPFITGTISSTIDAARDLREWSRQNNPFKATNGNKDPVVRQVANTASKMWKNAKRDFRSGDLSFKSFNKVFREFVGTDDMFGGDFDLNLDFDSLDNFDIVDEEESGPTTAAAVIGMGESLGNDIFTAQAASTQATVGAIEVATNKMSASNFAMTDMAVNRIISSNMIATTRISSQMGELKGSIDTINQNLMSIVQHNNESIQFFSQAQSWMEKSEQSMNDIKALLGEIAAPSKKREETFSIKDKPDFMSNGFDIKKYMKFVFNDSSLGIPLSMMTATVFDILKLKAPSFVDTSFKLTIDDILPIKTLTEKLVPAISRLGNLDTAFARGVEIFISKMSKGEYGGLFNLAGLMGMGVDRFNKTRFRSDGYYKDSIAWNGKSERALQEVIPDYLSSIENYLKIIAGNTGGFDPDNSNFQRRHLSDRRTYDYEEGEFLTNSQVYKKVQKNITEAVQMTMYDTYDKIGKLLNGSDDANKALTEFIKKTFEDEDRELSLKDEVEFNNILHKYRADNVTTDAILSVFGEYGAIRGNAIKELGKVRNKISNRSMVGANLGELINKVGPDIVFDSKENLEKTRYEQMTEAEKAEYDKKKHAKEEGDTVKARASNKFFGVKDETTGFYSGGQFTDLANAYVDFKKNGTKFSQGVDFLNQRMQAIITALVYGGGKEGSFSQVFNTQNYAKGTNSLPTPGLFVGNTGERIESIPVKRRVDNFVNLAEAFGEEARDIKLQLSNMGKDRGVGNFRFADGADEINSKDLSLTENADGTFNLIGRRGGSIGTLGENGITYTSYGKKARSRFDKKHGAGSFDDLLGRQIKAKKEDKTGNKFIDNYINQMESSKKPQTVGEELVQNMNDIAHNTNVIAGQSLQAANAQSSEDMKNAQSELSKRVFGEKDENGFYQGKFMSDFANMGVDFKNMINHAINGKGYTTSAGVKIKDSDDSIQANIGSLGDKAMQAIFGKDYKNKKGFAQTSGFFKHLRTGLNGAYNSESPLEADMSHYIDPAIFDKEEEIKGMHEEGKSNEEIANATGIDIQSIDVLLTGTLNSIFGGSNQNDINDSLNSAQEETNKKAQEIHGKFLHGVKGGLIGLGAGLVGVGVHGLIPSLLLPGGPIGGAILGVTGAMLSKNDKFMNWMFGGKDDDGKRIGGIISRDLQEKFKSFGSKALGPGVLGAIGGLIFPKATSFALGPIGGALLGGGPIGGALLGVGASMLLRSEAMQKLWYGEDGDGGVKAALGKAKDTAGKFLKKNAKGLALTGLGAGAGALLGSGLFGATLVPGLFGATIGLAASSKSFSEFLFGTKREKRDEDGNVIGFERDGDGFLGKVGRMISLNLLTPFKRFAKTSSKSIAEWFRHDILWQMKSMIAPFTEPLHEAGKELAEAFADLSGAAAKLVKKVFNPLFKVGRGVLKFAGRFTTGMLKGGARLAGNVVAAPFKILGGMGRAIAGKQDSIRDHKARFRYGNSVDSDFKYEGVKHGFGRIFNPFGRVAAWGMNKGKHALTGAGQILTGAGDSAFSKISPWHAIPEAIQAGKRTKGGAFAKINSFGQALNPFNIFDKNRKIYAENNGLTNNAAFMNPIEKRRHKRAIHEINFDEKTSKRIERRAQRWAKQDGYNNKIELSKSEFNKRKRFFARQGIKVDDIRNSQDLLNLMYDPLGKKAKDKFNKDSKEEKAKDATIKATDILSDISKGLDKVLDLMFSDKNKLTDAKKEHIRDLLKNDPRRTAEDIERDFGIKADWVQKVMDEDKAAEEKKNEKRNKREERNAKYGGKEGYRQHLLNKIRGIDDDADMSMANGAKGLDDWMDNNAIGRATSNILSAPVMAMSKLRDKLSGIDDVTRKNIIQDLNSGMSESDVAAKYGLKVKQIKRIISEEEVRNTRAVDGAKLFSGKKKSKTNANKKDGDGEEETPFVNATLVGEDGKPLMGKKSFLGKLFGAKGVLTTIGVAAAGAGIVYLLTKFPQIIDFAKETIWPLLRDVVWPTLKTLLTGIGAAIVGVGDFIRGAQDGVTSFMNFCSTGEWVSVKQLERREETARDTGTMTDAEFKAYAKTGGFYDITGKSVDDQITAKDLYIAAYAAMGNKFMLDNGGYDAPSSSALLQYVDDNWSVFNKVHSDLYWANYSKLSFGRKLFGNKIGVTKKDKEDAANEAIRYLTGDRGMYRDTSRITTVLENAKIPESTKENIGYGHFMQNDPRWANHRYARTNFGSYTTMANGGCGPTALANVAAQSGIRTNPSAIASMAQRFGYTSDGGSTAGLFTSGASRLGLKSKAIGAGGIRRALSAGNKVIFAGKGRGNGLYTNAGHILSARGIDKNGNAIVDDPMRHGVISVPISKIGNGITHAWSIGRGEDNETSNVDMNQINNDMISLTKSDARSLLTDDYMSASYYYQKNPKWADKDLRYTSGTIGEAGCVISALGSMLATITGLNYRPDFFTEHLTDTSITGMLQSALPPSLSGIKVERFGLIGSSATHGKFTNADNIDMTADDNSIDKSVLRNNILNSPFVVYGGSEITGYNASYKPKTKLFKSSSGTTYGTHALMIIPSAQYKAINDNAGINDAADKVKAYASIPYSPANPAFNIIKNNSQNKLLKESQKYANDTNSLLDRVFYVFDPGSDQVDHQNRNITYKELFDKRQGVESVIFLKDLPYELTNLPGYRHKGTTNEISQEDSKWMTDIYGKDAVLEMAATAEKRGGYTSPDSTDSVEEEEKDDSFIGALGRALSDFTKIIWNNVKALFSKDHQYHSIYDENKVTYNTVKGSGSSNTYDYQSALANAIGSSISSDGMIEYYGKQVPINSLSPQQIAGAYYAQEMQRKNLEKVGGITNNGDGTITVSSSVIENSFKGGNSNDEIKTLGGTLISGLKRSVDASSTYSDAINVLDYSTLPTWAKKFVHVTKSDFISEELPTSSKLSSNDILDMVKIMTKLISHHEAGGSYDGSYNDMGMLSVGINGFHAGNAAEIFGRMKNADTEGDALSDADRNTATQYENFAYSKLSDPLWTKYPAISNFLNSHGSANKKIQDAMVQQLQFSALDQVLPLLDDGVLNDPRSIMMISQFAGFGPGLTQRFVRSLRDGTTTIGNNSYGEFAGLTRAMDKWYTNNVKNYRTYQSGFRNRFRDIYNVLGGEGDSDAIGFGGNIRDSYTTTYPTIVDTPVAINSSGPVEVEAPVMSNQLELIIHYLKEIAMAAKRRPVTTATTAQTNLDIGHGGLAMDQKLKNAGLQRQEVLPVYTEKPEHPDKLKSIHNRIARSPRPV